MKNISLSVLLSAALMSTASAADPTPSTGTLPAKKLGHSGLYLGAVGTYAFSKIPTNRKEISANGLGAGVTGGYTTTIGDSKVVAGFEGTFLFNHNSGKTNWTETTAAGQKVGKSDFDYKNTIEVVGLLGYNTEIVTPFLKAGIGSSSVETTTEVVTTSPAGAVSTDRDKKTARHTGLLLGAGVMKEVLPHLALGLDYGCTFYPKAGTHTDINLKSWTNNKISLRIVYVF